jgi:L-iditol 2-dehydrogenase
MRAADVPPEMRVALWAGPGERLRIERVPTPEIERDDQVLLRVRAAVFGRALVRATTVGHPKWVAPAVLGSLVAGDVCSVGSAVGTFRPGMAITVDPHPPCGTCEACAAGVEALCMVRTPLVPGGLSEYVRLGAPLVAAARQIPAGMSYRWAAYTETVACAIEAASHCARGDRVLVVGSGPLALLLAQGAQLRGARRVVVVSKHPLRRAIFEALGAVVMDLSHERLDAGIRAALEQAGADVVFEAVGRAETYMLALGAARLGGTVVAFGGCPPGTLLALDPNLIHYRGLRLIGSYHYAKGKFDEALRLLAAAHVDLTPILTHHIPIDRISEAPQIASSPECMALTVDPHPLEV